MNETSTKIVFIYIDATNTVRTKKVRNFWDNVYNYIITPNQVSIEQMEISLIIREIHRNAYIRTKKDNFWDEILQKNLKIIM